VSITKTPRPIRAFMKARAPRSLRFSRASICTAVSCEIGDEHRPWYALQAKPIKATYLRAHPHQCDTLRPKPSAPYHPRTLRYIGFVGACVALRCVRAWLQERHRTSNVCVRVCVGALQPLVHGTARLGEL
jgi:hypothetical protein